MANDDMKWCSRHDLRFYVRCGYCMREALLDTARKAAAMFPRERDQDDGVKLEINLPPPTTGEKL